MRKTNFNLDEYLNNVDGDGFRKAYKRLFCELGLTDSLCHRDIISVVKTERFEKGNRATYPQKPQEVTFSVFDTEHYLNCITGKLFFHDRVTKGATMYGYIPRAMVCNNGHDVKIRRTFYYIDVNELYEKKCGYRERAILDSLSLWQCEVREDNGRLLIEFLAKADEDGHQDGFTYDLTNRKIVG